MKAFKPEIVKLKDRTVLTVTSVGDPNKVAQEYIKALDGTAYGAKFKFFKSKGKKMEIGLLVAQWPDAHIKPKNKWTGVWGLEVSSFVKNNDLLQKNPKILAKIEKWKYGTVAQILYKGPYSEVKATISQLYKFINDKGYRIAGSYEEEYLTRPTVKVPKIIIRHKVIKK